MPERLVLALLGASATPSSPSTPTLAPGLSPDDVSPGLAGFIATAAVVAVSILLILSLVGRLRRIRHRADVEARERAEQERRAALEDSPGPVLRAGGDEPPSPRAERPEHLE